MRAPPERRALVRGSGQVPAPAERGEARELAPPARRGVARARLEQLVAGTAEDVTRDLLERQCVLTAHLSAPVAEARRRRLREVLVLGRPRCVADEIFVAELEVAAAHVRAEPPRRQDLSAPPRRELGGSAQQRPRFPREALRQL